MRRLIAVSAFAIAQLLTACGSDSSTQPTAASVAGTYNLNTVNGTTLPFTVQAADPKIEVIGERLTLNTNGRFLQEGTLRMTNAGTVSTEPYTDAGTYTVSGTTGTFRFESDGSTSTGTFSGNTFTVTESGFTAVYLRQ